MTERVRTGPRKVNRDFLAHAYGLIPRLETGLSQFDALLRWTAGPVIAGIKPAALVRLPWKLVEDVREEGGTELCRTLNLSVLKLREGVTGTLTLLYRQRILTRKVSTGAGARYLRALGYPGGPYLEGYLSFLKERFEEPAFPHEVGIFLGYPLEDVISFSTGKSSPHNCRGYWQVYGRPEKAERTFAYMDAARLNLVKEIFTGNTGVNAKAAGGMPENIKPSSTGITATSLGNFRDLIRRRVI
ncbi:MAG: DUF3793 family protein [Treponema sp.]|jgi:hypothetical protein|nr:DUF3793 family protein [Treponema sp.]